MIGRRNFLKLTGLGVLSPFFFLQEKKAFPNIVLVLADDLGWSDLGCYGGEIETPNLDRLARQGVRFTQMHNTAKCFPSRACLLTGRYAQHCGMDKSPGYIKEAKTLGEVLRSKGYLCLMTGKHHGKDNPFDRGFDHYYGLRDGAANYFNPGHQRENEEEPAQKRRARRTFCFDGKVLTPYTPKEKDFYSTDYFTNWALGFLDRYAKKEQPYFLYVAYQAPHDPLQAWDKDIARYKGAYLKGYDRIAKARYKKQQKMGLIDQSFPLSPPDRRNWESLSSEEKEDQDQRMAVYGAMVHCMDRNIGRLLKKIQERGEEENTLVIFASDNGCSAETVKKGFGRIGTMTRWASLGPDWANVCNTPFRYFKNYSHQGGVCTPMIAYWPKKIKPGGRITHFPGHFIDIMATLMEITGAVYPACEGESLLPILKGENLSRKKPLFWQWSRGKAVRKDGWKLVSWRDKWELYDMGADKTETSDLSKTRPKKTKELKQLFERWRNGEQF